MGLVGVVGARARVDNEKNVPRSRSEVNFRHYLRLTVNYVNNSAALGTIFFSSFAARLPDVNDRWPLFVSRRT